MPTLRILIAVGLALLLMSCSAWRRSASARPSTTSDDRAGPAVRCGGSPGTALGIGLVGERRSSWSTRAGGGALPRRRRRRRRRSSCGLRLRGRSAIALAIAFCALPHGDLRPSRMAALPGRARSTRSGPRSSTRSRSAARVLGLLVAPGSIRRLANLIQAILYALATRLGAPGRDRYLLAMALGDRARRRLGHGRHRRASPPRAFLGHAVIASCRVFLTTGAGADRRDPRGRGDRGAEWPAAADGWRHRPRETRNRRRRHDVRHGAAGAESPVASRRVALYVHIPFCVSLCPYCDFVVVAGAAARGPANRVGAFVGPSRRRSSCGPTARRVGSAVPGRRSTRSTSAAGRRRSCRPTTIAGAARTRPRAVRPRRRTPRSRSRRTPGRTSAATRRLSRRRGSPGSRSAPRASGRQRAAPAGPPARPADVADAVGGARAARDRSVSLDLLYDIPRSDPRDLDRTLEAAPELEPDHLSLYALTLDDPDAEGLTGAGRRPPADDDRAPGAGAAARAGPGRGSRGRRSTTTRRTGWRRTAGAATRSATGPGPATRAATTSPTGSAGRTRRSARRARVRRPAALERGPPRRVRGGAGPSPADRDGRVGTWPELPPGGQEVIDAPDRARPRRSILGLRTDRGLSRRRRRRHASRRTSTGRSRTGC